MPSQTRAWYTLESDEVSKQLQSSLKGLTSDEASKRLITHGHNRMKPTPKKNLLERFFYQFHNILIYVLLGAALITALLEHWIDSGVIVGVVMINAIIGVVQEGKAEKALDAIRNMLSHHAMVQRDGTFSTLSAEELVPGDIVRLQSGDKVPADLRLITLKELRIDEALLTGESLSVQKQVEPVSEESTIGDRRSLAYSGTLVTYGTATGIVVATGENTEIGQINAMLREVQTLMTPLLRQIGEFARWLTAAIIVIALMTLLFGVFVHDYSAVEMFMAAVGLAVAAIPEGLPAIMTITLALGVQQMARRHAIIRRLPAVETLGSVTVICSDKTGTLTRNEMTVQSVATASGLFEVSGTGYDPHGGFNLDGEEIDFINYPVLAELARAAMLCNDAAVTHSEKGWQVTGDPTEGALVTLGMKSSLNPLLEQEKWPRTDTIPFESEHGFMATLHHDHQGNAFIYLKGSPEKVLQMCSTQRYQGEILPLDHDYWQTQMEAMASKGQRILAIAFQAAEPQQKTLRFDEIQRGLSLLGIVGMIDPPRSEAVKAVTACQEAGIKVKMITGDHLITAKVIGQTLGIGIGKKALSGTELQLLSDEQLSKIINDVDIFARTSPEQKLRLVTTLQAKGHVVAMTGDGVNDAPALKRADVGIAMGQKGTEVSKEAAEIVLADDNFASIVNAIEEGRRVYDNLKKSILFILPTNGGEALIIIAAILFGRMLPITPVQILWVNMITAVTLALTLAFESAEGNVMKRPPRDPKEPLLSAFLIWRILLVSLILMVGTFGLFVWYRDLGSSLEEARTVAVNTLVVFEIFYLFSARHFLASAFKMETLHGNKYALYASALLIGFQLLFTYAGPMQALFQTTALSISQWVHIIFVGSSVFLLVEFEKWAVRIYRARSR
ncbi:MAG: cation-transporting P-type ATPase [Sulfurimonadaceae bacterium]